MPEGATAAQRSAQASGKSWMLPEAKNEDLLYVVASEGSLSQDYELYVFSFPKGKQVGVLNVVADALCTDGAGNIFLAEPFQSGQSKILEYAHGGTQPIETLSDPYASAYDCSVDPRTGNLAVANASGTVLVYAGATGTPKVYNLWFYPSSCGYDNVGNLFAADWYRRTSLAELPQGGSGFIKVRWQKRERYVMGVQWDGAYLAIGEGSDEASQNGFIRRYVVNGNKLKWAGGTRIEGSASDFFIQGSTLVVSNGTFVYFFAYPQGGHFTKVFQQFDNTGSVAVSVGRSRSRIHR